MKYRIEQDSYWLSNGCSCCEPYEEFYYKILKEDGNYVGCEDFDGELLCYTYNSEQEALEKILELHGIEVEYVYKEEEYED